MTSKLSRHRGNSFFPLREFDQQFGLLFGPFARFRSFHCCPRSEDQNLRQLRLRFGRDEGRRAVRSSREGQDQAWAACTSLVSIMLKGGRQLQRPPCVARSLYDNRRA